MVKTTKKQTNKKIQNKSFSKKISNKKVEMKNQKKTCCFKSLFCCKGNLSLKIFFLTIYTFVILLFLTIWSKLHNKQIIKEQKCLIHKLYCCSYDKKTECKNWEKYCRENKDEKINCDLGK